MRDDEIGNADSGDPATEEMTDTAADQQSTFAEPTKGGELERLSAALSTERDKHLRLAAEFDNFRKRTIKERQEAGSKAQADLVQGLIEVLDDIMRFAHLDPATVDSTTVVQGVAMVERKVMKQPHAARRHIARET